MPGWAQRRRAPSHGGFVVCGVCLTVCYRVGGFMGPSPSVLLQVLSIQRAIEMNWGVTREQHSFLSSGTPISLSAVEPWGCIGARDLSPCWAWSPVFVPFTSLLPLTSRWRVSANFHCRTPVKNIPSCQRAQKSKPFIFQCLQWCQYSCQYSWIAKILHLNKSFSAILSLKNMFS